MDIGKHLKLLGLGADVSRCPKNLGSHDYWAGLDHVPVNRASWFPPISDPKVTEYHTASDF